MYVTCAAIMLHWQVFFTRPVPVASGAAAARSYLVALRIAILLHWRSVNLGLGLHEVWYGTALRSVRRCH